MDKSIRKNEICIIGQPRCDFVFSSTRNCFIAYGFRESTLEMNVLRHLLTQRGIEPIEAGGELTPAQSAFCAKICSKIITSQFCIVLLNNENDEGREIPNANVNMEYGLMLGFNKYVIPFQRTSQSLPFNVAGLDTIKYSDTDFERRASTAIDQAINLTEQDSTQIITPDQIIGLFLLSKGSLISPLDNEGDKAIFQMGSPLGFNLLNDFSGFIYIYFGNFTTYRAEVIFWRLCMLKEILDKRRESLPFRVQLGVITEQQANFLDTLLSHLQIWVVVTSNSEKESVNKALENSPLGYNTQIFSLEDVRNQLL